MRTWSKALIFACWLGGGIIGSMILANTVAPLPSSPEEWTPAVVNENFRTFMLTAGLFACMVPFMFFALFGGREGKTKRKTKNKMDTYLPIASLLISVVGISVLLLAQAAIQADPALVNNKDSFSMVFSVGCFLLVIVACLSVVGLLLAVKEKRRCSNGG